MDIAEKKDSVRQILKEICDEKSIEFKKLSRNWIIELSKNGEHRYIIGKKFSLNPQASANIADDKYATYEVLYNAGIPVIEHKLLFNPKYRSAYKSDLKFWREIVDYYKIQKNKKVVVKANYGSQGSQVYLCESVHDIKKYIKKLFKRNESISICPFYEFDVEYRTIYLDGECMLTFGKYRSKSWKNNLSRGAIPKILEDGELKERICDMAQRIAKAMNMKFTSIDIILTKDNELQVIEVNSGVTMNKFIALTAGGYDIAKKIYTKAIEKMFE
jgi:glutathione synthase/RimK-type ligase-like ATP-grasp enzyme